MGSITLGQIAAVLAFVVGIIGSVEYLVVRLNKLFDKKLAPITSSIANLDESQCKNFLVRFLKDKELGNYIDPIEEERAYEIYDHYSKPKDKGGLGCNSYIHAKWEKVMLQTGTKKKNQ